MASVSSSYESPGAVHMDMITHMLNQRGGAHKAIDRSALYHDVTDQITENASKLVTVKEKVEQELEAFLTDPKLTSIGFPPMEKVYRYLIHESADERGLVSYSLGQEGDNRHTIVWKKEAAPTADELQRLGAEKEVHPDKLVPGQSFH